MNIYVNKSWLDFPGAKILTRKKSNLQVKLNQVIMETKPRWRIHCDWLIWRAKASAYLINWYWLVLDTSSNSFTAKKRKNLLAFRRSPGSHRCSGSTRGEKLTLLLCSINGRREERTLGNWGSLSKLEEDCGQWNITTAKDRK